MIEIIGTLLALTLWVLLMALLHIKEGELLDSQDDR